MAVSADRTPFQGAANALPSGDVASVGGAVACDKTSARHSNSPAVGAPHEAIRPPSGAIAYPQTPGDGGHSLGALRADQALDALFGRNWPHRRLCVTGRGTNGRR